MEQLVIASGNEGKIREIRAMLPHIDLLSLADIGFDQDIPEPFHTFEENAHTKAVALHRFSGKNVFADDSGICVNTLNGEPGVNSAYYGGLPRSDEKNNARLLDELKGKEDRSAYYKAVICLIWNGETHYFDGVSPGRIIDAPRGDAGFGYDPLFIPDNYELTFGELPLGVKNELSHRGKAIKKMVEFINRQQ